MHVDLQDVSSQIQITTLWTYRRISPSADASTFGTVDETLVDVQFAHSPFSCTSSLHTMAVHGPSKPDGHTNRTDKIRYYPSESRQLAPDFCWRGMPTGGADIARMGRGEGPI